MNDEFRRWKYDAIQAIKRLAPRFGGHVFSAYQLRVAACYLRRAADSRWWGQALLEARDLGYIRKVAESNANIDRNYARRGRKISLWVAA